jgi:hypothetical protein
MSHCSAAAAVADVASALPTRCALHLVQVKFSGSMWRQISPAAKDFIRAMLNPDPEQRPSAADLLLYPWLAAAAPSTAISTSIMHQLQLFAGLSRARRVMLGVAARNINGSEASRLLKAFLAVDKDFNGTLEFHELAVAAKQVCVCLQRACIGRSSAVCQRMCVLCWMHMPRCNLVCFFLASQQQERALTPAVSVSPHMPCQLAFAFLHSLQLPWMLKQPTPPQPHIIYHCHRRRLT